MRKIKFLLMALAFSISAFAQTDNADAVQADTLFYESFDNMNGKGGNDGNWNISYSLNMFEFSTKGTINEGWANTLTDVRPACKCVVIGTTGNLVSPAMDKLNGAAVLTFKAGATKTKKVRLKVTLMNGGQFVENNSDVMYIDLPNGEFASYRFIVKGCTAETKIAFTNPGTFSALLLDEVTLTDMVGFDENTNNLLTMTRYNNKTVDVVLGKTIPAGHWNAICLPFSMTKEQIEATFGEETKLAEFVSASRSQKEVKFDETENIEAGKPYLIKVAEQVENPIVENVTVKLITNPIVTKSFFSFIGTTSPVSLLTKIIVLDEDQNLVIKEKGSDNLYNLPGLNAYFTLPVGINAKDVKVKIGDEPTTGINEIMSPVSTVNGEIYNLNGQKVEHTGKGIYIVNGKKIAL